MLVALLPQLILMIVDSIRGKGELFMKKMGEVAIEKRQRINNTISTMFYYALIACTIFLPLKLGTPWFYLGLFIWLLGLVILVSALVTVVSTPPGRIFTGGVYRFSRHPLYLSMILVFLGIGFASESWIFLLAAIFYSALQNKNMVMEEQNCLETFGEAYKTYMNKTARWFGIPNSSKN